jgi:6-phosphogluconolactonase
MTAIVVEHRVLADPEAVALEARQEIVAAAGAADETGRPLVLVLSGGRTPQRLYEHLAEEDRIDWSRVHFLWGDERCVPPDHPASNYRLAHEALISRIDVPERHVHRMRGEDPDPDTAARAYEEELASVGAPDLVLLGLGADGHTASLFPDSVALEESSRLVVPARAPAGADPVDRLTVTFAALGCARRVLFLVTGSDKRDALTAIREDPPAAADRFPAARVRPRESILWIADRAAGT